MEERTLYRIDTILEHIEIVLNDTKGLSIEELSNKDLLLRATCFSIMQIGEIMVQLEKALSQEFPNLPWNGARIMRNFIVHDYGEVSIRAIFDTINNDLPCLKIELLKIKEKYLK